MAGTDLDPTKPGDADVVADYPAEERAERGRVETLIATEHYEGAAGNDRHKIGVYQDDAARDAVHTAPQEGNFAFQKGAAAAANAPRVLAVSFRDGSQWLKGYFVPTGMVAWFAFDTTTPPEGWLRADGGVYAEATYADVDTVMGGAFDQQDGAAAPGGGNFRTPLIAGHQILGVTSSKRGQAGWVRNVSGLKDLHVGGTYSGTSRRIYLLEITGAGAPDTFKWSDDGGATFTTGVAITGAAQALSNGVTVAFLATTNHSVGDVWIFTAEPDLATVGKTFGVSAWRLVEAEIPTLSHNTAGAHTHSVTTYDGGGQPSKLEKGGGSAQGSQSTGSAGNHSHDDHGGDEAHENSPHALVLSPCIKT